jgi:hypothetical protein
MKVVKYKDFPLEECLAKANEILKGTPNTRIFQKFTCAGCGSRLTIAVPNEFHSSGTCDNCDAVTDIRKSGCNYLVIFPSDSTSAANIDKIIKGIK